ncbi:hypothetical protein J2W56_006641 [Nocardia kruczakiae]|uniref:Secretory lipase n=1 Tax=Nocardia kruczakiae TaxID=261477 RepID=A0ABU1XQN3_9NOCA|nr:lipase family protein [Nocardia kruczakiae]MDR7172875.1 hypothetical protein [Nocardia kruczakiae]
MSGTVITPENAGGLAAGAVLVYEPSFHGLGSACAPSQLLAAGAEPDSAQIRAALARGFTVAVVDGEGLGVTGHGPHTFLAGRAAGQVMLDLGRAARRIPALNAAQASIVLWGYADGGRAAVSAGVLQSTYAPELDLRGIAAGAVVTDPGKILQSLNRGTWAGLGFAALIGLSRAHRHLPLRHVFTEETRRLLADAEASNRIELCERYRHPLGVWCERADPWNDPIWRVVLVHELISTTPAPAAPLHLYHGDADAIVPIALSRSLFHDYRACGAHVDWHEYRADHFRTARAATADVLARLTDDLTHPPRT